MVVGRLKAEVSKLRENNYGVRALNNLQSVSREISDLRGEINKAGITGETEQENMKKLEEDLEQQRNIFKEFEHVEADLKKLLTLEEEEITEIHSGVEQTIEYEKEIEATILALAEEIEKIEKLASKTEETLTQGEVQFNTKCVKQAIEHGTERIYEIYENAEEPPTAPLMVTIERKLKEKDADQIGSRKQNFAKVNLQEEFEEDKSWTLELAIKFNELLYHLGKDCVDKTRYIQLEEELAELKQLIEEIKQVAEQLTSIIEEEKEIIEFEQVEKKQLPQTVEGLKELGQEIQLIGKALEKEEATQKEVLEITRELKSNPREIQREAHQEIQKLEENLENLERIGHEIEAEAERLEVEQEKIGELNRKEEQQLEELIEKGEKVETHLKTISDKILHSDKIGIGHDDGGSREEFRDRANLTLQRKISIGVDQTKSVMEAVLEEAEKLKEMTEKEEQIELEIKQKDLQMETFI